MLIWLLLAQAEQVDVSGIVVPIIVALIAAAGGSLLTFRATNKNIASSEARNRQEALAIAEETQRNMSVRLAELYRKLEEARAERAELQAQLEAAKALASDERAKLEREIHERDVKIRRLSTRIEQLHDEVAALAVGRRAGNRRTDGDDPLEV